MTHVMSPLLPPSQREALEALYRQADARAARTASAHADWPCRRGCDHCCRNLAAPLPVSGLEWAYLWEGFQALPADVRAGVRARVAALPETRPYVCPLLDPERGACLVYAHRPLACRTYGFYVSRGQGSWCDLIVAHLARRGEDGLVFGNQDAADADARALGGEPVTLFAWFAANPA